MNKSSITSSDYWGATFCDKETSDGLLITANSVVKCRAWANAVTIPNSVTSIGDKAFYNTKLSTLTIGTGLLSISSGAFSFSDADSGAKPVKVTWLPNTPPQGYIYGEGTVNYVPNNQYTLLSNKTTYQYLSSMFDVDGVKYVPVSPSERTCDAIDSRYDDSAEHINIGTKVTYRNIEMTVKNVKNYVCYKNPYVEDVVYEHNSDVPKLGFYGCKGLRSLVLNNTGNVGTEAFRGIANTFSAMINNTGYIGKNAFSECTGLDTLQVGSNVTDIIDEAFSGCRGLTSVTLSNQGNIGKSAFASSWINGTLVVNNGGYIGTSAFDELKGSFTAKLDNAGNIGTTAFRECTGLTALEVGSRVTNVYKEAFYGCTGLTSVTLSNQGDIGESAFAESKITESLTINSAGDIGADAFIGTYGSFTACVNNTGSIGSSAFKESTGLKELTIGKDVSTIGEQAFFNCGSLDSISVARENPTYNSRNNCNALIETASDTLLLGSNRTVIPENVVAIEENAFYGCSGLSSITIPESVKGIGSFAFYGCNSLPKIVLPDSICSLGLSAFENCSNLASVTLSNNLTEISDSTFYACDKLDSLIIPNNIVSIGDNVFSGCGSLSSLTIPKNVASVGNNVFRGCKSLKEVIMQEDASVLTLGSNNDSPLFADCPLDSVFIGRNISYPTNSSKGYSPFYRNTSLKGIRISDVETEVSLNEFYGCTNLKNVLLGDGITTIGSGSWAFSGCSSLGYFQFGSNVKKIGTEAFSDCTSMTKLISCAVVPPVCGDNALDDINKWECILLVPDGSLTSYQEADQWKEFFFIDIDPDGIEPVHSSESIAHSEGAVYDLSGRKLDKPQSGINILRMSDGTTRKVLMK